MKKNIEERFDDNIRRVKNLVNIYENISGPGSGRRGSAKTDVLRAAVVLLHASLEDFLRSLARWKLPEVCTKEMLDEIPAAGIGSEPKKFRLGYLLDYRGKKVDEVINLSVEEYLERSNYNNTTELSLLLKSVGVDVNLVSNYFSELKVMMDRRHQVVHRADRDEIGGKGKHKVRSISTGKLNSWTRSVNEFCKKVLGLLN